MTKLSTESVDPALVQLRAAVLDAATFLGNSDESLCDGNQTAREVLAHLVFWHREYVRIARALAQGQDPKLRSGKFRELNALADQEFREHTMSGLSKRLVNYQHQLEQCSCSLYGADVRFSLKQGTRERTLHDWSPQIQAHISSHVLRLKRTQRRLARPARSLLTH